MTDRKTLESMADEAFQDAKTTDEVEGGWWLASDAALARFAELVRADERERWQAVLRRIANTAGHGSNGPCSAGWTHWAEQARNALSPNASLSGPSGSA